MVVIAIVMYNNDHCHSNRYYLGCQCPFMKKAVCHLLRPLSVKAVLTRPTSDMRAKCSLGKQVSATLVGKCS